MTQQPTSIESFRKLNPKKTAAEHQKILDVFECNPKLAYSDRAISELTGLAINIVESRRGDLNKKHHKIMYAGTSRDFVTGRRVQMWRLKQ
jgi:hypothetical protein